MTGAGGFEQQQQVAAWKAYLAWECSNPQKLTGPELTLRINLAYDQALMTLRLYPDVCPAHAATNQSGAWLFSLGLFCRQQQTPALCVRDMYDVAKSQCCCQLCLSRLGKAIAITTYLFALRLKVIQLQPKAIA